MKLASIKYMNIRPVRAALIHAARHTDGWTERQRASQMDGDDEANRRFSRQCIRELKKAKRIVQNMSSQQALQVYFCGSRYSVLRGCTALQVTATINKQKLTQVQEVMSEHSKERKHYHVCMQNLRRNVLPCASYPPE